LPIYEGGGVLLGAGVSDGQKYGDASLAGTRGDPEFIPDQSKLDYVADAGLDVQCHSAQPAGGVDARSRARSKRICLRRAPSDMSVSSAMDYGWKFQNGGSEHQGAPSYWSLPFVGARKKHVAQTASGGGSVNPMVRFPLSESGDAGMRNGGDTMAMAAAGSRSLDVVTAGEECSHVGSVEPDQSVLGIVQTVGSGDGHGGYVRGDTAESREKADPLSPGRTRR